MMQANSRINDQLRQFQAAQAGVTLLGFVDLGAEMVLSLASRRSEKQENLDRLAAEAARLLVAPGVVLPGGGAADEAWVADARETRAYLRGPLASDEALVAVLGPGADARVLGPELRALADALWPAGAERAT